MYTLRTINVLFPSLPPPEFVNLFFKFLLPAVYARFDSFEGNGLVEKDLINQSLLSRVGLIRIHSVCFRNIE